MQSPYSTDRDSSEDNALVSRSVAPVNTLISRYPYCIVWTPLPLITWLLPFIGHVGIADSQGIIHDFAGPYHVGIDSMAFGTPTKYYQLEPAQVKRTGWDEAVRRGGEVYGERMHNLFRDNCHSHTAYTLNEMEYAGKRWNAWKIGFLMLFRGQHAGFKGFARTYLPSFIVWSIVLAVVLAVTK